MANYWVGDAYGRVLGPLGLETLQELTAAGRLKIDRASTDGKLFGPLERYPEIARVVAAGAARAKATDGREQARQLSEEIRAMRARPVHEVFNLPADASIDAFRASFFALVKRFYPASLPRDADESLRSAYAEMFQFLSKLMADIERRAEAGASPPPPVAGAPSMTFPKVSYDLYNFVGWERRENDRVAADVRVTLASVGLLTENKLVNISNGGMFLAVHRLLPLGQKLELTLHFDEPPRDVSAKCVVVWVNEQADRRHPRGVGIRFVELAEEDQRFIEYYVRKAQIRR